MSVSVLNVQVYGALKLKADPTDTQRFAFRNLFQDCVHLKW